MTMIIVIQIVQGLHPGEGVLERLAHNNMYYYNNNNHNANSNSNSSSSSSSRSNNSSSNNNNDSNSHSSSSNTNNSNANGAPRASRCAAPRYLISVYIYI